MPSQEYNMSEIAALGIYDQIRDRETLNGLVEIAAYLSCSIGKVRKLVKRRGLPAFSIGPGSPYLTTKTLVNKWIAEGHYNRCIEQNWS